MINEPPLVSIISATLDAAEQIPYTLRSIAGQAGASFEWIVVDGGSKDGTRDLLRSGEGLIAHWLSEPDAGIYDAWNKGCRLARGQWMLFTGAGDEFVTADTLARFGEVLRDAFPAHDLVYGRVRYISLVERRELEEVGEPWARIQGTWELSRPALPPHQAVFHHRSLFDEGRRFDASFRIAGDSHFLLRYGMRKPPLFVPRALVRTPLRGISMDLRHAAELSREIQRINQELGFVPPLGHRVAEQLLLGAKIAASCLPAPIGRRVADFYRRIRGRPARWSVR